MGLLRGGTVVEISHASVNELLNVPRREMVVQDEGAMPFMCSDVTFNSPTTNSTQTR